MRTPWKKFRLKEYHKAFQDQKFRYYQLILVHTSHVTPNKTQFLCTEGISVKHSKMKDLDINSHY